MPGKWLVFRQNSVHFVPEFKWEFKKSLIFLTLRIRGLTDGIRARFCDHRSRPESCSSYSFLGMHLWWCAIVCKCSFGMNINHLNMLKLTLFLWIWGIAIVFLSFLLCLWAGCHDELILVLFSMINLTSYY